MDRLLLEQIATTLSNLENSGKIKELVTHALSKGIPPLEIVEKGLRSGLESVGKKYEDAEYFLSELVFAGELAEDAMEVLQPSLKTEKYEEKGVIVLGTVFADIHDIGKNIFKMYAQAAGFVVHDIGVDVEAEIFLNKLKETKAGILGLSSLLTTTRPEMKTIIDLLQKEGIRDNVKVLLGGNAVTKEFGGDIGADGVALDAVEGVKFCKRWMTENDDT